MKNSADDPVMTTIYNWFFRALAGMVLLIILVFLGLFTAWLIWQMWEFFGFAS